MIRYASILAVLTLFVGNNLSEAAMSPRLPEMDTMIRAESKNVKEAEHFYVGISNECHVDSRVNAYVRVYINGVYRGTIPPYGDIYPIVGDLSNEVTILYAVSTCGRYSWSRTVAARTINFQWMLFR